MVTAVNESVARPRDKKRIPRLDGIRGLCALSVVVAHVAFSTIVMPSSAGGAREGIWSVLFAGQLSIGPFFILSGLLLYRPFARHALTGTPYPSIFDYVVRRSARMLPGFWLVVTASMLLLNFNTLSGIWDVLRPYALMHIYDHRFYPGLDVAWTVPTEAQFYVIMPLIGWFMTRMARKGTDPAYKAKRMLIPLIVPFAAQFIFTIWLHSEYDMWTPKFFYPFGMAALLAAGMGLAVISVLWEIAPEKTPRWYTLAIDRPLLFWFGALVCYLINCAQPFGNAGTSDWLSPAGAVVRSFLLMLSGILLTLPVFVPGSKSRLIDLMVSNPVMVHLGRISYGIYLWQFTVIYLVVNDYEITGAATPLPMMAGQLSFWSLVIPSVLGTIAVAFVSFYAVERPIIQLAHRWTIARKARKAPPGDPGGSAGPPPVVQSAPKAGSP